jgi:hypothetical protein
MGHQQTMPFEQQTFPDPISNKTSSTLLFVTLYDLKWLSKSQNIPDRQNILSRWG